MPSKAIQNKTKTDQPYVCPFTMNFRQKPTLYQTLQAKSFRKKQTNYKVQYKNQCTEKFWESCFLIRGFGNEKILWQLQSQMSH